MLFRSVLRKMKRYPPPPPFSSLCPVGRFPARLGSADAALQGVWNLGAGALSESKNPEEELRGGGAFVCAYTGEECSAKL